MRWKQRSRADKVLIGAAFADGLTQALFAALRTAGVTDWNLWLVSAPVLVLAALFAVVRLVVVIAVAGVIALIRRP